MSVAIRVSIETHEELRRLAAERKQPIGQVVAAAVDQLNEAAFWAEAESALARLQADPAAWADYQAEFREWEAAGLASLTDEPGADEVDESTSTSEERA
jgi:hypothetical protein